MKLKAKVPGQLSEELKVRLIFVFLKSSCSDIKPSLSSCDRWRQQALGMVDGVPPPWLLNMQRYGPPPAYPNLKIPGLNAPIPEGASFGYHPGGWGKPPVDEVWRISFVGVTNQSALTHFILWCVVCDL